MASYTRQIANLLGTNNYQARQFAEAVRKRLDRQVRYALIVQQLKKLDPSERTADAVVAQLSPREERKTKGKRRPASRVSWLEKLTNEVQGKVPYSINEDIVEAAVQATDQRDAEFLSKYLDKYTPLILLGDELGTDPKEASLFCEQVNDHLGYHVKPVEILEVIKQSQPDERTVDAVVESLAINEIAKQLNIGPTQAARLPERLEKYIGKLVKHREILHALDQLSGELKRVNTLAQLLRIAKELELNPVEVRDFMVVVAAELADQVTYFEMLKAVCSMDMQRHQASEVAWQIRIHRFEEVVGEMPPTQARKMLEEIDQRLPARARSSEIDRALNVLGEEEFRIEDIAEQIIIDRITNRFIAGASFVESYIAAAGVAAGQQLSAMEVLVILAQFEEKIPEPTDIAVFLRIANILELNPASTQLFIRKVDQFSSAPISLTDLANALELLDDSEHMPESIAAYVELCRIVERHQLTMTPEGIRSWLMNQLGRSVQYSELQPRLGNMSGAMLPDSSAFTATDLLIARLTLAFLLDTDAGKVTKLVDEIFEKTNGQLDIQLLVDLFHAASPENRRAPRLVDYIVLAYLVEADENERRSLNNFVNRLYEQRLRSGIFWQQVGRAGGNDSYSMADLANLLDISQLPIKTLRLLEPTNQNERWIRAAEVDQTATHLNRMLGSSLSRIARTLGLVDEERIERLHTYHANCWAQINSSQRIYQVPSEGRAEIETDDYLRSLLDLTVIRFVTEGTRAPALHVQFRFANVIGVMAIFADGRIRGFHQLSEDGLLRALIEAVAVSYYRDLVLPGDEIVSQPTGRQKTGARVSRRSRPKRTIPNPRRQTFPLNARRSLNEWYKAQERARHYVRGHVRRCQDPNFIAIPEKQNQARAHGIILRAGQTWVVEHERGKPRRYGRIVLDGFDLVRRTVFRPPVRATAELNATLTGK